MVLQKFTLKMSLKKQGLEEETLNNLLYFIGGQSDHSEVILMGNLNALTGTFNYIPSVRDLMNRSKTYALTQIHASTLKSSMKEETNFLTLLVAVTDSQWYHHQQHLW